tara:strand:+ start:118 stop:420 length:303 start_codon:yes stop_codon:yes gene_type:complete
MEAMENYKTETITNNHNRDLVYRYDVPQDVLDGDLDWTSDDDCSGYLQYRGYWYHLSQFMVTGIEGWDGFHGDSFFSGVAIRLSEDCETYQIATILSVSA